MPEHVPNTVLVNKYLKPPNNTTTVPDTPGGKISGDALIGQSAGAWDWAPLPDEPEPGQAAEPVEYAPVDKTDDKGKGDKPESKSSAGKPGSAKES